MPTPEAIPVSTGFTWTAAGAWGAFLTLLGLVIKNVGPWRKQTTDAETQLRAEMSVTIKNQEEKIERLEAKIEHVEELREQERAKYEAERSLDRHKINNLSQCIDTIFLMLEATPEKVVEVVARIRQMRARQLEQEAVESATLRAAAVTAKTPDKPE